MTLATFLQITSNHYYLPSSKLAIGCVDCLVALFGLGAEKHKKAGGNFGGVTLLAPGTMSSRKVAELV